MQRTAIRTLGVAVFGLAAVVASAQPAQGPKGGPKGPGGFMLQRAARALNLTADQQAAFQKVMDQQKPQMDSLHQQMRDNRQKLEAALSADNPDPAAVGTLAIEGHKLRQQGRALHEQMAQALRALLTPEQQTKFDALQSLRESGPGPWGGRGHWGGGQAGPQAPPQ